MVVAAAELAKAAAPTANANQATSASIKFVLQPNAAIRSPAIAARSATILAAKCANRMQYVEPIGSAKTALAKTAVTIRNRVLVVSFASRGDVPIVQMMQPVAKERSAKISHV